MLEANTFRSMMLVGGVMTLALILAGIFTIPAVDMSAQEKTNYENVMNIDLDDDVTKLTVSESLMFYIKGSVRGNVNHY